VLDSGTGLGHFQHCSVMRLSCLDELLNNFFVNQLSSLSSKAYCYLCHSRDMISKEGPVFWWNLWLIG